MVISESAVREFTRAVASEFGVTEEDVFAQSRFRDASDARHAAWYLVAERYKPSQETLAEIFSRDRSTISSGLRKMRGLVEVDATIRDRIERADARAKTYRRLAAR